MPRYKCASFEEISQPSDGECETGVRNPSLGHVSRRRVDSETAQRHPSACESSQQVQEQAAEYFPCNKQGRSRREAPYELESPFVPLRNGGGKKNKLDRDAQMSESRYLSCCCRDCKFDGRLSAEYNRCTIRLTLGADWSASR